MVRRIGGRRIVLDEGARKRLGALFVTRHQGQREEQLVLDEIGQVERRRQRQDVVFAFGIERLRRVFALDEEDAPLGVQRNAHRLQAALALERHLRVGAERQRRLRARAAYPPGDFARGGAVLRPQRGRNQAGQAIGRPGISELAAYCSERGDVETMRVEITWRGGHRPSLGRERTTHDDDGKCRMPGRRLVLASTSRYRSELLARLRLPFAIEPPEVDEGPHAGETPAATALRLALAKASAVAMRHPAAVVIGSDQVADLAGHGVGKPGDHDRATAQLRAMRGRVIVFQTAVAVACVETGFSESALVPVTVRMRELSDAEIERYLRAETPYDCAGSAKIETLGIALVESVASDDPTALIGLPLISTCALLRRAGIDPLGEPTALRES